MFIAIDGTQPKIYGKRTENTSSIYNFEINCFLIVTRNVQTKVILASR